MPFYMASKSYFIIFDKKIKKKLWMFGKCDYRIFYGSKPAGN